MSGIFKDVYPYTDFHELNLDWVITTINKLDKSMDEFKVLNIIKFKGSWDITKNFPIWSIVDLNGTGYLSIKNVPAGIEIDNEEYWVLVANYSALFAEFEQRLLNVEDEVNRIKFMSHRKVLIIGDSYNTGHGGGQNIETMAPYIAGVMKINENTDIYNYSEGGAGFLRNNEDSDPSFERNLDNSIAAIDDKNAITDICVIGGANDWNADSNTLQANMTRFADKALLNYPNAKLWLFAVGWAIPSEYRRKLVTVYRYYSENGNFVYTKLYHLLQNKLYMGETWHPNNDGVVTLGRAIGSVLCGGNYGVEGTSPYEEYYYFSNSSTQSKIESWCDSENVYIQFNSLPAQGSQLTVGYDPVTLGVGYLTHIFGYLESEDKSYADHSVPCLAASSSNSFKHFELMLRFMRTGDGIANKVLTFKARTYDTNNGGLNNISIARLYVTPNVITIPIWAA